MTHVVRLHQLRAELLQKLQTTLQIKTLRDECEEIHELVKVLNKFHVLLEGEKNILDKELKDEFLHAVEGAQLNIAIDKDLSYDETIDYVRHNQPEILHLAQIRLETQLQEDLNNIDQQLIGQVQIPLEWQLQHEECMSGIDGLRQLVTLEQNQSQQRQAQFKQQKIELEQQLQQRQEINQKVLELYYG